MRFVLLTGLLACLSGCGPLFVPMLPRLDADSQRQVDQAWDNMLTPVQRVDRQTLLDANIAYWMYTLGVDRMHMTSEKYFTGGRAVMEIDCDRANPDADQYSITVLDDRDRTLRRERYTRAEVEESSRALHELPNFGPTEVKSKGAEIDGAIKDGIHVEIGDSTTQPSTRPAWERNETPEERKYRQECERRQAAAAAATQPARLRLSLP